MDRRNFIELAGVTTAAAALGLLMRGAATPGNAMSNPSPSPANPSPPKPSPKGPAPTPRKTPKEDDHVHMDGDVAPVCTPQRREVDRVPVAGSVPAPPTPPRPATPKNPQTPRANGR